MKLYTLLYERKPIHASFGVWEMAPQCAQTLAKAKTIGDDYFRWDKDVIGVKIYECGSYERGSTTRWTNLVAQRYLGDTTWREEP